VPDDDLIGLWSEIPRAVLESFDPDGDFGRKYVLNAVLFRMLGDVSGQRVLDAGAGQGYLTRLLAGRGAVVTAYEPAHGPFSYMAERETELTQGVTLVERPLVDVSPTAEFDAVVCSMVLLAIPDWRPALASVVAALRPGGTLVVSVNHPCFEGDAREGPPARYVTEYVMERPVAPDFHRTVSTYVNAIIASGCSIVEVAEPVLRPDALVDRPSVSARTSEVPDYFVIAARKN
jgi:2-polyprenyl-3-methyl-5-hydroxy-6-metoxy-1,4-benzoquinol methylase